jgi:hypothetical protein
MGNVLEGKTYVKGSHKTIQPKIATNVDIYKSQQRISTATNIHRSQAQSQVSFTRQLKSENLATKKLNRKPQVVDDIKAINQEGYDEFKYAVKKLPFRNKVSISMA